MKKNTILFAIVLSVLLGCKDTVTPPKDVLDPVQYAKVLTSIHLVEAEAMASNINNDTLRATLHAQYRTIWAKHGVDSAQFYRTVEWYRHHPEKLQAVYQKVHENLLILQEEVIHH